MKVLLIAPLPKSVGPVGGMGSVTENMIQFLKKDPNGIDLILCNTLHKIRSITSNSMLIRLFTGIINSLGTCFKAFAIIKNNKPDVIHLSSSASFALLKDYLIVKAANRAKIPVVMHWHFGRIPTLIKKQNREWKILQSVIRSSTLSIAIDKKTYVALHQEGYLNVIYIPNPLASDVEQKAKESSIKPKKRQRNSLIYVGHIIRNKGVYELVEACSQISIVNELILIGSYPGDVKEELTKIANKRNGGKWLNFAGQQKKDRVLEFMLNSPVLVLPSYTEGFPMVVIEAMAMGCAIIATDVGAIPEILAIGSDEPCGICVPPQNLEKLKNAIITLVKDPDMIDIMGKRGIERTLNNYNPKKVITEYIQVWETVVAKRFNILSN